MLSLDPQRRKLAIFALCGVLLLVGIPAGTLSWDRQRAHAFSYAGLPRATDWAPSHHLRVFHNAGHLVGYSEWRRNPLWVSYRLDDRERRVGPRPERFRADPRSWVRVGGDALRGSGYTRGHLAPNYAIARVHGRDAQLDTFRMSNISPQSVALNTKLWQRIEEAEIDRVVPRVGTLWVVAGPVFGADPRVLPSGVEVPERFYKIWLAESAKGPPRVLAFLVPQEVRGDEDLRRFIVSVDEVEALTGLDFFHKIEDEVEDRIEAQVARGAFAIDDYARLPPRY